MPKEAVAKVKLQVPGGQVTPAPPVGPALGQHGINIGEFVSKINEATKDEQGMIVAVAVTVYQDRSFDFVVKSPPAPVLLKKAAGIAQGSAQPNRDKVGTVTPEQLREIARRKQEDLNAYDEEQAMRMIAGTARSMGIEVAEA